MTRAETTPGPVALVAIDIAKARPEVLIEPAGGRRRRFRLADSREDCLRLADHLRRRGQAVTIGFEAPGNYHRPLAPFLQSQGFALRLVPTLAIARTREAMHNSWDKNDPRDARVILHLLKTGITQTWHDPLIHGTHDAQELSKTLHQLTLAKTRLWHSLRTHFFPLYFPEVDRFIRSDSADWLIRLLLRFPTPASIAGMPRERFVEAAWDLAGRKVRKATLLGDIHAAAEGSIGLPAPAGSPSVAMFRLVLGQYLDLCRVRGDLERPAVALLQDSSDGQRPMTVPGIGPITALTIVAEAGDLRRFPHHRQFLRFCGLDLATQQSGRFRGASKLSKHGNARLRTAFWMAAQSAVRMRENSFRAKFDRHVRAGPLDADLRRKAYTAVAAKMARVAHGLVKSGTDYRRSFEAAIPGG